MSLPRLAVWLWLGGGCLLAVWAGARDEAASQLLTQRRPGLPAALLCSGTEASGPSCPHKRKSATLVPSFTKTTTPPTTVHMKTTSHPTTHASNHTTRSPTNHTTVPANHTTPHPTNHTTPFHTAAPINHTTMNYTTSPHPTNHTTPPANHTTTPWPTDTPFVAVGNYTVKNGSTACLRLEAGLQVQVQYTSKAKQKLWGAFAVQPIRTNASGDCSSEVATLKLQFPEGFLIFIFKKNQTTRTSYLNRVQANLTYQFRQATGCSHCDDGPRPQPVHAALSPAFMFHNTPDLQLHRITGLEGTSGVI
ncbi:macrosialin isoform X2 [Eublepharis macularius]|uniref:Macrosialin isoform X2 n=1 Tax=Eublepharis macularius TaxID=481883 RepID=A0AA97K6T2_EUBMA|nr:macrosialin isoform X2 [Eublepharis macularius]